MHQHRMRDHHLRLVGYHPPGALYELGCFCGAAANDPVHGNPPCDWCDDAAELGAPGPWWHRIWCRFCAWLFLDRPTKN